ncbi:hypothetical protein CRM94_00330 [Burkholderia gladioli]|uniref:Uncharacterized protein n=2 Tax=Burkholderiaceae TaxID=119060 RepID=A0A2A7SBC2_BURGA|nr:hypothetical protein CO712_27810 [Burkholderia gladioli pv. gladioli]PEH40743.1 hypothetical protein CRM94_00330 [Burkholderia gladioli]
MTGSIDGYCGIGMMIGRSVGSEVGAADGSARLLDVYTSSLVAELARHREYARRAYRIGVDSVQDGGRRHRFASARQLRR